MKRYSKIQPGYDCIAKPCGVNGCGERPGSSHGRHCDNWVYVVSAGDVALDLVVFAGNYPSGPERPPIGSNMSVHAAWPLDDYDIRDGDTGGECEYIDGGRCWSDGGSALYPDQFFRAHGRPTFEQPESFWLHLEAELTERVPNARAMSKRKRCSCCNGTGVVES